MSNYVGHLKHIHNTYMYIFYMCFKLRVKRVYLATGIFLVLGVLKMKELINASAGVNVM